MTEDAVAVYRIVGETDGCALIDAEENSQYFSDATDNQYYTYCDIRYKLPRYRHLVKIYQPDDYDIADMSDDLDCVLCYGGEKVCDLIRSRGYEEIWTDGKGTLFIKR